MGGTQANRIVSRFLPHSGCRISLAVSWGCSVPPPPAECPGGQREQRAGYAGIWTAGVLAQPGDTALPPPISKENTTSAETSEKLTVIPSLPKSILNSLTTFFQTQVRRPSDHCTQAWALVCQAPHTFHFALLIFKPKQLCSALLEPQSLPKASMVTLLWGQMRQPISPRLTLTPLAFWSEFPQ